MNEGVRKKFSFRLCGRMDMKRKIASMREKNNVLEFRGRLVEFTSLALLFAICVACFCACFLI
jgi:hypothetical protein